MSELNRRRFLSISAAAFATAGFGQFAAAAPITQWHGVAMGAAASIRLRHPEAKRIIKAALAEIDRLENIFSLYRAHSHLSQLNATGRLDHPPFELLEVLGLCGSLHTATQGRFDPTVQPLWELYAEHYSAGRVLDQTEIDEVLHTVGWRNLKVNTGAIAFAKPGMALTLNGIAQGFIADKVAALLRNEGLSDVLVDTGELRAVGGHPDGGGWPVTLKNPRAGLKADHLELADKALATSAVLGTVFDEHGRVGHILDPRTGRPAPARWSRVSVVAPRAALADGLSTAMCLMSRREIEVVGKAFPDARIILA